MFNDQSALFVGFPSDPAARKKLNTRAASKDPRCRPRKLVRRRRGRKIVKQSGAAPPFITVGTRLTSAPKSRATLSVQQAATPARLADEASESSSCQGSPFRQRGHGPPRVADRRPAAAPPSTPSLLVLIPRSSVLPPPMQRVVWSRQCAHVAKDSLFPKLLLRTNYGGLFCLSALLYQWPQDRGDQFWAPVVASH